MKLEHSVVNSKLSCGRMVSHGKNFDMESSCRRI
jgi:hypothetical protein